MNTTDITSQIDTQTSIELKQNEVDDLLGDAPNWLIYTGSYLFYGILILLLIGAMLIHYPDVVQGTIVVEDIANVEWVTVNTSGKIESLLVKNDSLVKNGDAICVFRNAAQYDDVLKFVKMLANVEQYFLTNNSALLRAFSFNLSMGEMTDAYENFLRAVRVCLIYDDHHYFEQRQTFLQKELTLLNSEPDKNALAILKAERDLFELSVSHQLEIEKNMKQLESAYTVMMNSLQTWELKYLIRSHSEGRIVLGEVLTQTRLMNKGDTIATVISNNKEEFVGRMILDQEQVAGVRTGNPVSIRLAKYPEHSFGRLTGAVSFISFTPYNKQYIVDIALPAQLRTTANKALNYEIGLKGNADIIISNQSVLSRIFNPITAFFRGKNIEIKTNKQ